MRRFLPGLLGAGLLALAGCSSEPRLIEVEGVVTYQGKPIPKGVVFFDPDVIKKHTGTQGFAYIIDGKFTSKSTGRGVMPGNHVARVEGMDGKPGEELPLGRPLFKPKEVPVEIREGQPLNLMLK